MKVTIISAHEGSLSWVKTIDHIAKYADLNYVTILSDDKYRSSSVIQRIVNRVMIYLIFPLKVVVFYRRIYREDCILVVTSPFYMPLLASLLFKHTKLLILHNDLYPEGFYKIPFLNKYLQG